MEPSKPYPVLVQERAISTPERVYAIIPRGATIEDGFFDFTYTQLSRAVDKMSWWLDERLGKSVDFPTLAYVGASDLRYCFLFIAAVKTRRQVLFPLNQNSRQAHLSLLSGTKCEVLLTSKDQTAVWDSLRPEVDDLTILTVPDFEEFLLGDDVESYPYNRTWEESKHDPILNLHSSGTTGLPKLIRYTSYMFSIFGSKDETWEKRLFGNMTMLLHMPPSWSLGLVGYVLFPLRCASIPILFPKSAPSPMTAEYLDKMHVATNPEVGVYIPILLKELCKRPEYLDHMRGMKRVVFAGGPLDKESGDVLNTVTDVKPCMGSTEVGSYGLNLSDKEDWQYYHFDPAVGFRFDPFQVDEGLYESVLVRHAHEQKGRGTQMLFYIFPELDEYRTNDVWREHETKKGRWKYAGRTDDFVKLSTMTKFNASHIEGMIGKLPWVKGVVMGGEGKDAPFLMLELEGMTEKEAKTEEMLGSVLKEVNDNVSDMIKLQKHMIIFARKDKPMVRGGVKGTVLRRGTLEIYDDEIQSLYIDRST